MPVLSLVLPIFAVIVTGWAVARLGILPAALADSLIQFAYYVAMPALLFATIAKEPVASMLDWRFIASFGGGSLLVFALVMIVAHKRAHRPTAAATVWGLAAAMTNTGFVALPILHGMFGEPALLPAAVATFFVAVVMFPTGVVLIEGDTAGCGGCAAAGTPC